MTNTSEHSAAEADPLHRVSTPDEPMMRWLGVLITYSVRVMAVLMGLVIVLSVADVAWVIYQRVLAPPVGLLNENDIVAAFGAFMASLIAIEIFANIVLYLRNDVVHVKLVLATALMAVSRKVIILDDSLSSNFVWALAGIILALSIGYFLVSRAVEHR